MDIGKFLNFFCDSYFWPFSLTSINLKIKDNIEKNGEECDGDQSVPVRRSGRAGYRAPVEAGSASFWPSKKWPSILLNQLC